MSKSSKSSLSGLNTVTRDWSESRSSQPSDSEPIHSPSIQPLADLSPAERRLKLIQDALAEFPTPTERVFTNQVTNKRPALSNLQQPSRPKKVRQLPSTWGHSMEQIAPPSTLPEQTSFSRNITASKPSSRSSAGSAPPSKITKVATVFLSSEQTQISQLVQDGHSVFYTGSAGTGKSVLLNEIIKIMRKKYVKSPDAVAITASTGIAACNIGGVTLHSFAGIGLGTGSTEELVKKVKTNKKACARWLRTKVLIIDEISMVDGDLFDKLAQIGCALKKSTEPFGGIQVVVTGDFFQLPPVTKGRTQVKFAFEADLWEQAIKRTFNLSKVFRQHDQEFVNMLNEMRFGRLSHQSIAKFKSLSREIVYEDGLGPTELFPRREDVDKSNSSRMARLQTEPKTFRSLDGGTIQDPQQREKMLANFMAPANLTLRVDAQVMLIKNTDEMLVNGTMGKVVQFADPSTYGREGEEVMGGGKDGKKAVAALGSTTAYPVVEFILRNGIKRRVLVLPETWKVELPNGEVQVSRNQLPLILSWAMSIHKAQGQTLDRVKVDLGKVFEKGQAYVALSRATSLEGLQVLNFDPNKVKVHPKVVTWSKTLETVTDCSVDG